MHFLAKLTLKHINIHAASSVPPPRYLLMQVTPNGQEFLLECHQIAHDTSRHLSSLAIDGYAGITLHHELNYDEDTALIAFGLLFDSAHKYLFSGSATWMPLNFAAKDLRPSPYEFDCNNVLLTFNGHDLQIQFDFYRDAFALHTPINLDLALQALQNA